MVSEVRKVKAQYDCLTDDKISTKEESSATGWKTSLGMSVKNSVGPIHLNGTLFTNDSDKTDLLNNFFVS